MSFRDDGLSLYRKGLYSEALEVFQEEEIDPAEDTELAYYMGLCHARLQDPENAIRLFKQVLDNEDNLMRLYQVRMLLVWLLVNDGDIDYAMTFLRKIFKTGFHSPQAWSALGYCQYQLGQTDFALESYRKAVQLDGENANAVNGLGYLLADTGKDMDRAIELCRWAVDRNPDNFAYKDSLGWALFRSGKISEAIRYLTVALSLCPGDEVITGHIEAVRIYGEKNFNS